MKITHKLVLLIKEFLPMYLLVCFSGNPVFTAMGYAKNLQVAYALFFLVYIFFTIDRLSLKNFLGIFVSITLFIFILIFFQRISLGFVSYPGVLGFISKLIIALCTIIYYQYEKIDFIETYIKVLTFTAIVSLPLDFINQFTTFGMVTGEFSRSVIIYTAWVKEPHTGRNFGMFWEPGAFAGYLILAMIFIAIKNGKFQIGPYGKQVLWIVSALLTTGSTTGYVIFGLILIIYSLQNFRWGKIIIVPVLIIGLSYAFFSLDFLQKKMDQQFIEAQQMDENKTSNTRFGALKMDWQYISSQPLIGNGLHVKTRFRFHPQVKGDIGHGNGMSNFLANWGFPFFLFWLFCVYKFTRKISHSTLTALIALVIIILVLQGEQFLNFPLFLSFFALPFLYENILAEKNRIHFLKKYFNI